MDVTVGDKDDVSDSDVSEESSVGLEEEEALRYDNKPEDLGSSHTVYGVSGLLMTIALYATFSPFAHSRSHSIGNVCL